MEQVFELLKNTLPGIWRGEGFAKFPSIEPTGYTEVIAFTTDTDKQVIHYAQKAWYKNDTPDNSKMVFWDTGFIIVNKQGNIQWISAQSGGRTEVYALFTVSGNNYVFDSEQIGNDPKTIRSQRVFTITNEKIDYQLNMSTHQSATFQNHLAASLKKDK
ncbi:MAG TPA: heme-binding beta-barrel domain-containing protein [Mucilaginibacter sp.]|jgi:hypothetical protein